MATNILMPALSPTMTEGTLARWLKKEGEPVRAGDVIAEIETDKATMEIEAVDEGVLGKILVRDGTEGVKVNEPIAVLIEAGETLDAPVAKPTAAAAPAQVAAPVEAPPSATLAPPSANDRVFASPLARRMAAQAGIDLAGLTGSGPNGRIVRADIEAASKGALPAVTAPAPTKPPAPRAAAVPGPTLGGHKLVPHSSIRKVIARRLTEAKSTIPHFYVSMDIDVGELVALMDKLNAKSPPREHPDWYFITINDLVIKACALTQRRHPAVNASWTDDAMAVYEDVDISVAVAIPDGLITPIVRRADQKGLLTISREMKDLAARARAGKLKPEEFQGGGFSISNMGMFGVTQFNAIINPPQAAILAVGAAAKRAVVRDDKLAIATEMTCTLSVDHRVVDGALGAAWMKSFKQILEDPLSLML
jgi:pyruvate dehydrogenase E2 component (dihydrolipoamide acetyltransferase)